MTGRRPIRVGATNITGLGATQLFASLLPALEALDTIAVETIYLPDRGDLAGWRPQSSATRTAVYRRQLPRALSRVLECGTRRAFYAGGSPLLTLGDVPVRTAAHQVVLVQSPHLTSAGSKAPRYAVARALFRANLRHVGAVIVQTAAMRAAILNTYPLAPSGIHVVGQPPPGWLLAAGLQRRGRVDPGSRLSLFYPAAGYPHKNHALLATIDPSGSWRDHVARLVLTVPPERNPAPALGGIDCIGQQPPAGVIAGYATADALLFLSTSESYGFPLVEAMTVGLPIICPHLPYAHVLCGESAIYFQPHDPLSLCAAVAELAARLDRGWWPDWTDRLRTIPRSWDEVAKRMAALLYPDDRGGGA